MFGVINIMYQREKQEMEKQLRKRKEKIELCFDKTKYSLYDKIVSEMKKCSKYQNCIISDCKFKKNSSNMKYYTCMKYYDELPCPTCESDPICKALCGSPCPTCER